MWNTILVSFKHAACFEKGVQHFLQGNEGAENLHVHILICGLAGREAY